ncbi:lipopolysaccharide assembly protein LapA domain-containing protein [Aerosakkonemataceae cyanobacterium BLCC-F154]|uniref:Lipopolysaccharide assembly protein LapA domain-containing protein n=1 Tax=Floridaenema fluviatile BLCC-F154 TaxID=3153640 RepID=A0ABV4Y869_9CYAN
MRSLSTLIICLILAVWMMAIAILSVQNATPVTLKFLAYESIRLPVGVVLAFSAAAGAIVGAIVALPLFSPSDTTSTKDFPEENYRTENRQQQTTVGADDWTQKGSTDW